MSEARTNEELLAVGLAPICPKHQRPADHLDHLIDVGDGSPVAQAWACLADPDAPHVFRAWPP